MKQEEKCGVIQAIAERSSTRGYTQQALTEEELNVLIRAGLQAPTAVNKQEVHITVVSGTDPILAEIHTAMTGGEQTPHNFYYEAPTVMILSADAGFKWSALDAGIAVENIALAAHGLGLGSLIIGCIRDVMLGEKKEYFAQKLKFPEGYEFEIAVALGHKGTSKEPHTFDEANNVSRI